MRPLQHFSVLGVGGGVPDTHVIFHGNRFWELPPTPNPLTLRSRRPGGTTLPGDGNQRVLEHRESRAPGAWTSRSTPRRMPQARRGKAIRPADA